MGEARPDFLTVRELAALLRVKARKVYALAAAGDIPCSRATGKILFPRAAVDAWLARHGAAVATDGTAPRPSVLAGSHDPLLDWALRESQSGIATFFDGSLDGLVRFQRGEAAAAGLHVFEPDGKGGGFNVRHVAEAVGDQPVVLIQWAMRERGLIVSPGNPGKLRGLADLAGKRVMPRQPSAGSQILLLELLAREGVTPDAVRFLHPPARNETDLALAVADAKADAAFGLSALARRFRLDFVPVVRERYDLLVWRRFYFEPPFQSFLSFCRSEALAARAAELGGYDLAGFGTVHFNGA